MLKTYLYVPEELDKKINLAAKSQNRSKAAILRQAIQEGLAAMGEKRSKSAELLLKLDQMGKKYSIKGPKDGSQNMDKYLWDKDWSKDE